MKFYIKFLLPIDKTTAHMCVRHFLPVELREGIK